MYITSIERAKKEYLHAYFDWEYTPHRWYPLSGAESVMLSNYNIAQAQWSELDLNAAYIRLFASSLPVEIKGEDIRLSPTFTKRWLPPIGELRHHGARIDYERFVDIKKGYPKVWLCFCQWPFSYPEPPWALAYVGGNTCGFVVECKDLSQCMYFAEENRLNLYCLTYRDLYKYGALVAIGRAARDHGVWHYYAIRALSGMLARLAEEPIREHGALASIIVDSVRISADYVKYIISNIDKDVWPYKHFTCESAHYDYMGLINRRCEEEGITDYRLWVVGQDLGSLSWPQFNEAARALVYERRALFPSFRLIAHLFKREVRWNILKPLNDVTDHGK